MSSHTKEPVPPTRPEVTQVTVAGVPTRMTKEVLSEYMNWVSDELQEKALLVCPCGWSIEQYGKVQPDDLKFHVILCPWAKEGYIA